MFRNVAHGVLEVARAIDAGHAIRHGARPRSYAQGGPLMPDLDPAEVEAVLRGESDLRP